MIAKVALRNMAHKPLNTVLSLLLLTAGVGIITLLILLERQFEKQFSGNLDNIDLVMGAKGSPLQLILSSVYQMDAPTGNIPYTEALSYMENPFAQSAVPLAYGDNYRGFRIVGTVPKYAELYGEGLKSGKMFSRPGEVVAGFQAAQKLGLKLGDTFRGSHGSDHGGEVHEEGAYTVVGIAKESGKVIDNLLLCDVPTVWQMHGHQHVGETEDAHGDEAHRHDEHAHEDESHGHVDETDTREITAVLFKIRNKMALVTWPRMVSSQTSMQMASPAVEVNRLFTLFGFGLTALRYMAYGIMLISAISIFVALFSTLRERKYEFALMRISGAGRGQMLALVLVEAMLLCVTGFILGTALGRIGLLLISRATEAEYKISFDPFAFVWGQEGLLFAATLGIGILSALIPALMAYRLNISKTLANA